MLVITKNKKLFLRVLDFILTIFLWPFSLFRRKDKEYPDRGEKILLLELWGLGDLVLATSALKTLKTCMPNAVITLLAKPCASELFKNRSIPDVLITFDFPWTQHKDKYKFWKWDIKGLLRVIKALRKENYSLALDARMDFRNNFLMWLVGAKRRLGYNLSGGSCFLTDVVPMAKAKMHRVEAWEGLLRHLGIEHISLGPHLEISADEKIWARNFLANNGIGPNDWIIGIHPGAGIKKRCWSLKNFLEVAKYIEDKFRTKIIVFVEPQGYGEELLNGGRFIRAKLRVREFVSVLSELNLFICNDGGPMHMACAVNTPVLAIFGPGDLDIMGPYGHGHRVIIKDGFPCRPCRDYCKYKEPYCLTEIAVEDVIKAIDEMMKSNEILTGEME